MADAKAFLDTNILVYAFSIDPKADVAEKLLAAGGTVSVQGLNEFANVARRKLAMTWQETRDALAVIRTLCAKVVPVDVETHDAAMRLAARYQLSVFDAVMIASGLQSGCDTFWSEDMQSGLVIEDRLVIRDPFA